jgi:hypothetical protein
MVCSSFCRPLRFPGLFENPYKCLDLEREKSLKKLTLEHDELAPWCFDVSQLTGAK